jgi:erythromycin esterase
MKIFLIAVAAVAIVWLGSLRVFASFVLGEPFFGQTIASALSFTADPPLDSDLIDRFVAPKIADIIDKSQSSGFDLSPILAFVGATKIVGVGEATHGSHEFAAVKSELFKKLVTEKGYRVLAIESDFAAFANIDSIIAGGPGDLGAELARNGYWVINTSEMLSLLEWIRSFNAVTTPRNRIRVVGMDAQSAWPATLWLRQTFSRTDNILPSFSAMIDDGDQLSLLSKERLSAKISIWKADLADLKTRLPLLTQDAQLNSYNADLARQMIFSIETKLTLLTESDFDAAYTLRDSVMADRVEWAHKLSVDAGVMVWAHNGHIGKGTMAEDGSSGIWLGKQLEQRFGAGYYAIGFQFSAGDFVAHAPDTLALTPLMISFIRSLWSSQPFELRSVTVKATTKHKLATAFSKLSPDAFFLHFGAVEAAGLAAITGSFPHYEAGAAYVGGESATWDTNLVQLFDGVIHFKTVTAAGVREPVLTD